MIGRAYLPVRRGERSPSFILWETMNKLKLELDELAVESFDTLAASSVRRGTVKAFGTWDGCPIEETAYLTCPATCANCDSYYTCTAPSCVTCLTYCQQLSCVEHCA